MFFKALLFFQLILLAFGQAPMCSDAEVSGMNQCWMNYLRNFGFQSAPSYKDYMSKYFEYLDVQGPMGLTKVCSWVNQKDSCESSYKYDCQNAASYMKILNTNDSTSADDYFTAEAVNVWECGPGYNMALDHFYCKLSIHTQHQDELNNCMSTLMNEFGHGFNCSYATEYVSCNQKIYLKYCGTAAARFACNFASIAMEVNVPQCSPYLPVC